MSLRLRAKNRRPARSYATRQAARTTLFAAGNARRGIEKIVSTILPS
jgi:hypothetical protein